MDWKGFGTKQFDLLSYYLVICWMNWRKLQNPSIRIASFLAGLGTHLS